MNTREGYMGVIFRGRTNDRPGMSDIEEKVTEIVNHHFPKGSEKLFASKRSFVPAGQTVENGRYILVNEVKDMLAACINELLAPQGFKYLQSQSCFKRNVPGGQDLIRIVSYDFVHYQFDIHFYKRIDAVQQHVTRFNFENGFNSINDYKKQETIWVCYSHIVDRIEAVSYDELAKATIDLLVFISNSILPYFPRLDLMLFFNDTLNYPEKDEANYFSYFSKQKHSSLAPIAGLITARLVNDPHYKTLFEKYMAPEQGIEDRIEKLDAYIQRENILPITTPQ